MRALTAAEIEARLLYRDGLILVIDKPAGLPVHRPPRGGPSLEDSFPHLRFGLPRPPALAHRLDRETSGCLALGRHRKALARLSELFRENAVEKTYWALVAGRPAAAEGRIELALGKVEGNGAPPRMQVKPAGLKAVTDYRLLAELEGASWLEVKPLTGRTHQIRVHLAALGSPVLGDPLYGNTTTDRSDGPLQLHARALVIPLRKGKLPVAVQAPPPAHMAACLPTIDAAAESL
ncbi:MAG: RluA family pseudouridine synthase [Kiloniellales bacterium]